MCVAVSSSAVRRSTRRSVSGTWREASASTRWLNTRSRSTAWRSVLTVGIWPAAPLTNACTSGIHRWGGEGGGDSTYVTCTPQNSVNTPLWSLDQFECCSVLSSVGDRSGWTLLLASFSSMLSLIQFRVCIPLKDPAESFRDLVSAVFGAFPGCVTRCFTLASAKVRIYVTRCRHFLSFFLLFRVCKESWDMWGCEGS